MEAFCQCRAYDTFSGVDEFSSSWTLRFGSFISLLRLKITLRSLESGTGFLMYMMPTVFMSGRILGLDLGVTYGVQLVVTGLTIVATYWGIRQTPNPTLRTAIISIAVFLASPYAHNYDMSILSVAVIIMILHGENLGFLSGERVLLDVAWFLPIGVMLLNALGFPVSPLILALLFAVVLFRIWKNDSLQDPLPVT